MVARVDAVFKARTIDEVLEDVQGAPLLLLLDGVTDPHNLGACLRVADGAGAHAVIAPKDHAVGINAHGGQGGQRRCRDRAVPDGDQPGALHRGAEGA